MVVLVNGNSASASEILAGALQDSGVPVVGSRTYGKGTVQRFYPLDDGSYVKLTMARFFTPKGRAIQGNGIVPDYVVEMDAVHRITSLPFLGSLELGSEALHVYQLQNMLTAMEYDGSRHRGLRPAHSRRRRRFSEGQRPAGHRGFDAQHRSPQQTVAKHARRADVQLEKPWKFLHK